MAQRYPPQSNLNSKNSSLYCGDLRKEVTEANLFRIFNAVGPVSSIRVCRDAVSRQSLGYAYINFVSPVDAERALDTMNFTPINGKPCRLMWSERDPKKRKRTEANLFIRNLHHTIDNKTLFDTFSMFGDILSCKIQTDENGQSLGYGFVHYTTQEAAEKALARVNGMEIAGKKVMVVPHKSRKDRDTKGGGTETKDFSNLYLKNFPVEWDEAKLGELVKPFGECQVFVAKKEDGVSKGFGFANFTEHEPAKNALEALNGKKFGEGDDEKELYVARHMSKLERQKIARESYEKDKQERFTRFDGLNLYVKNLPASTDDAKLQSLFEEFGTITSAKVMVGKEDGKSRGFGFVCFDSKECADRAIKGMHSKMVENKPLFVCHAEMKETRLSRFQSQSRRNVFRPNRPQGPKPPSQYPGGPYPQGMMPPGAHAYPFPGGFPGAAQHPMMSHMARPGMPMSRGPMRGGMPQPVMPYGGGAYGQPQRGMPQVRNTRSVQRGQVPQWTKMNPGGGATKHKTNQELITQLATLDNAQAKQLLGEKLFVEITKYEKDMAGKITGMLLEMDNTELILLLEDGNALRRKITEALSVLRQTGAMVPQHTTQGPAGAAE